MDDIALDSAGQGDPGIGQAGGLPGPRGPPARHHAQQLVGVAGRRRYVRSPTNVGDMRQSRISPMGTIPLHPRCFTPGSPRLGEFVRTYLVVDHTQGSDPSQSAPINKTSDVTSLSPGHKTGRSRLLTESSQRLRTHHLMAKCYS